MFEDADGVYIKAVGFGFVLGFTVCALICSVVI